MTDIEQYGLPLLHSTADKISAGVITGPDWPNSQNELTRLQAAKLLREAADEIERLRKNLAHAMHGLHQVKTRPAIESAFIAAVFLEDIAKGEGQ